MFQDVKTTHGATGNGTTDDRAAFVAADGAAGTIYVPEGTYRIASNLALSSDIRFEQGAVLKPDSGVVVTLNGGLDARAVRIFEVAYNSTTHQPLANVIPNKVDQLLPQWWGARGDWSSTNASADDSPPIQAALAAAAATSTGGTPGKILFFPPGRYRVTRPLKANGTWIRGSGQYHSEILGATGRNYAIIEAVGASFFTIEGISLTTMDLTNQTSTSPISDASTVGILMARIINADGNTGQSWYVDLREVSILLHSDPTIPVPASGVFPARQRGTIGVYNYCVEVSGCSGAFIRGDTGWVFTSGNYYGLQSFHNSGTGPGSMFQGDSSMTGSNLTANNSLLGITGPALLLAGGANLYVQAYLANQAATFGATAYPYAIDVVAQVSDFEYLGSVETYARVLRTYAPIRGMRLHAYSGWSTTEPRIYLDTPPSYLMSVTRAYIQDSEIDVIPTPDSYQGTTPPVTGYLIDSHADIDAYVESNLIRLRQGKIWVRNQWGTLKGNLILAGNDLANVSVQHPNPQGNVIVALDKTQVDGTVVDGTTVNGVRLSSGTIGVSNSAAATTPGAVVRKIEVFDAAGTSLGFVPVYNSIT